MANREIPNTHQIGMFFHCGLCIEQYAKEDPPMSRADFSKIEAGFTPLGIQVWCRRHECNIVHIDFEGQKHPANTTRKA